RRARPACAGTGATAGSGTCRFLHWRMRDTKTAGTGPAVLVLPCRSGGGLGPAVVAVAVVEAGRAQLVDVEVVHGDGVQGDLAQLFQQLALLGGDHALGHGLVVTGD